MSSEWEMYVAENFFNKFETFEWSQYFSPDLREKDNLTIRFQRKIE